MTDENENGPGAVTAADVNRDAMAAAAAAFGERDAAATGFELLAIGVYPTTIQAARDAVDFLSMLVSEYGHEPTQTVTAITTTHDRTRTTWDALAADVKEWRNRYPNQRFYIVPRPGVVAVDDARPADPEVSE